MYSTKTYWAKIIVAPALCLAFIVLLSSCQTASLTSTTSTPATIPPKTTITFSSFGEMILTQRAADTYNYPVKPGTEDWAALSSLEEKVEVCQVPDEIIRKMSTRGLTETALNYPLLSSIFFFNSIQDGFNQVASRSNCVQALLLRKDAGLELFTIYKTMNPLTAENMTGVRLVEFANYFKIIELFMAQPQILDNMTSEQRISLTEECQKKVKEKKLYLSLYDGNFEVPIYILLNRLSDYGD